ncbi:MAG: porin family protein [Myxococcales bacterium]|nr:porin family protein [Myxococcales bacterium]MDH5307110.1 porin family protein [Myxococcales bacterium]MDH5567787.1 porin family protein [Myxococcales bacterium]
MARVTIISLSLALLLSVPAAAQEDFARPGFYLGIQGTTAVFTRMDDQLGIVPDNQYGYFPLPDPTKPRQIDPSLGVHARAGYRFLPHFAGEAHLEYLAGAQIFADTNRFRTTITDLTALTLTGNLKAYLTTGMVQPYALVGVGWMRTWGNDIRKDPSEFEIKGKNPDNVVPITDPIETDDSGMVGRFGAGLDIYVTPFLSIGAGATYVVPIPFWPRWGDYDYDYVSVDWGLQYRF